jgi:hypothetical protein
MLPPLEFAPGRIVCLHVPRGRHHEKDAIIDQLVQFAYRQAKTAIVCARPALRSRLRERLWPQTSVDWLATNAHISRGEAVKLIAASDIPVARALCANAGTPQTFLGILVAAAHRPDLVIYDTSGLDPLGCAAIHYYVRSIGTEFAAVHLSFAKVHGYGYTATRICPENGMCVSFESHSAG